MTNSLQYYREVKAGEGCSKCGKPLVVVAVKGKVFAVCLRCTHRKITFRDRVNKSKK